MAIYFIVRQWIYKDEMRESKQCMIKQWIVSISNVIDAIVSHGESVVFFTLT